jgi:hypothetical protein
MKPKQNNGRTHPLPKPNDLPRRAVETVDKADGVGEEYFRRVCKEAGAIYRGFQSGFWMKDGTWRPRLILFDGCHWRNTIGLLEPDFNLQSVRNAVNQSNRQFSFYNQNRLQYRRKNLYSV